MVPAAAQQMVLRSLATCTRTYLTGCCSLLASLPPSLAGGEDGNSRSRLAGRLAEALDRLPQWVFSEAEQNDVSGHANSACVANDNGDAAGEPDVWQACWRLLRAAAAAASAVASPIVVEKACQTDEPPELPLIEEPDTELELGVNYLTDAELELALGLAGSCRSVKPDADCPPFLPPPPLLLLQQQHSPVPPSSPSATALLQPSSAGLSIADKRIEDIQQTIAQQLRLQQQQQQPVGRRSSGGPIRSRSPAIGAGGGGGSRVAWSADDAVAAATTSASSAGDFRCQPNWLSAGRPELVIDPASPMRLPGAYPQQQQQRQLLPPFPHAGGGGGGFHPASCPSLRHCGSPVPHQQPPPVQLQHQLRPGSPQTLPYFSLSRPRPLFAVAPPAQSTTATASADAAIVAVSQFGKAQSADRI